MLVNTCMKFHEDILNGFKVTEQTQVCHRDITKKIHNKSYGSCTLHVVIWCLIFV